MSKVLLVDKEMTRVASIRQALERGGFETVAAADGNEALKTFLDEVPDLVMVGPIAADPDETFCHRMRETRPGTTVPIVLYCESLGGETLKAALERSGCNVYLELPASDDRILEVCRHALLESVDAGIGSAPGSAEDQAAAVADPPAFSSPGAALADLATSGQDIDDHLNSMFETGAPPPEPAHAPPPASEPPAPVFEVDMREPAPEPAEPEPEPAPAPAAAVGLDAKSPGDRFAGDLVGFKSDAVAFEQQGEVDPGIQPSIASEAESLFQSPSEPSVPHDVPAGPALAGSDAVANSPGSLDLDMKPATENEEVLLTDAYSYAPPATAKSSRGWLWGIVAAAVAIGGIGLFIVFRPTAQGDGGAENTASLQPQAPASAVVGSAQTPGTETPADVPAIVETPQDPAVETAAVVGTPEDTPDTTSAPVAESTPVDVAATAPPQPAPVAEPTAVDVPATTPPETASVAEPATVDAAATVATDPAADPPTAEDPAADAVFQPSAEIVDAATAGENFTPPRSIDRVEPTYDPADVPEGGETVVLRVLVNDWGKAVRVDVEKGRARSPLVEAAIDAVLNTRYHPAEDGGGQVRAWATETFRFE